MLKSKMVKLLLLKLATGKRYLIQFKIVFLALAYTIENETIRINIARK